MDLANNQEVQAALIVVIIAALGFAGTAITVAGIWLKVRGDRFEVQQKKNIANIETNDQNWANQVQAQTLIQSDLKRTQIALDEAKKETADYKELVTTVVAQNRALERVQATYDGKIDQLKELVESTMQKLAEKEHRIKDLERTTDLQSQLITQMQSKFDDLNATIKTKDDELEKYRSKNGDQEKEIQALSEEVMKLRAKVEKQQAQIDELEALNRKTKVPETLPADVSADIEKETLTK